MFIAFNKKSIKISQTEKLQLLFQISIMLSQKIRITKALELIIKTSKSKKSEAVCTKILQEITHGNSVVEAVDSVLKPPAYFLSIVKSGEHTGHLGEYLFEAYKYSKNSLELKNKQKMQSFYPIFVFCSTLILSIGIIAFAIPTMVSMAESLGLTLPKATITIINMINWLTLYWPYVTVFICGFICLIVYLNRKYRYFIDWILLKIPFFGFYIRKKELVFMLTLFSMLLKDKIPVEKALELSIESIKIKPFQDELAYAIEEIYRGKMDFSQLHRNFGKDIYVITFLKSSVNNKQLIENTKFITTMLTQEIENKKKHLLKLIEPISLGIIGLMVLLVITKVYLPVFEMFNSMDWMSGF